MQDKRNYIVFLLVQMAVIIVFGSDGKFKKTKVISAANQALADGNVYKAADLYREVLAHDSTAKSVLYPLAQAYFAERDYELAAQYFLDSYRNDTVNNVAALYYAALSTKMTGSYESAIQLFKKLIKLYKQDEFLQLRRWSKIEIEGCNFALHEKEGNGYIRLNQLSKNINSSYADYSPAIQGNQLYFSSVGVDTLLWMNGDRKYWDKDDRMMKIFVSERRDTGYTRAMRIFKFAEKGKHFANPSVSYDATKFFYTVCDGGLLQANCVIYMSEWKNGNWTDGLPLSSEINLPGCTNTQPYLSVTNTGAEVLFFVSNRDGGKGGKDIWYSYYRKGIFTTPRNAGPKVNTDRDELTPFLDSTSNTLFFSSDGWMSMGGLDVFKIQGEPGKYQTLPENMGAPLNSPADDYYYRSENEGKEGFIVSNRAGIFSVRGKTCCDDIFAFKYEKQVNLFVRGIVRDAVSQKGLSGVALRLQIQGDDENAGDLTINFDTTSLAGGYCFSVKPGKSYKITISLNGYFGSSQVVSTQNIAISDTLHLDFYLNKLEKQKAYRLSNIYYDYGKADLRVESEHTLDTLCQMMNANPTLIIEVSSHTDSRGSDQFNNALSQKRAEACVQYLVNKKGLSPSRVTAKGYGKLVPIQDCTQFNECKDDINTDCNCHQLNRRTEFKVIGELEVQSDD